LEYAVDIYEDSIPLRFSPDGLDEAAIDALIEQAYTQVSDMPADQVADITGRRRVRRQAGHRPPHDQVA